MAVAFDTGAVSAVVFAGTSVSKNLTIAAASNVAATLGLWQSGTSSSGFSSALGGVSGSALSGSDTGTSITGRRTQIFAVTGPATGAQTASASWTTSTDAYLGVAVANGCDPSTPVNGGAHNGGPGSGEDQTVTPATGNASNDIAVGFCGSASTSSAQTALFTKATGATDDFLGIRDTGGSALLWAVGTFSAWVASAANFQSPILPIITAQPTDQTVASGSTATFSLTATGATSYQWQQFISGAWSDIGGATSNSYTTGTLARSDGGTPFRCNVTNASGTTTSNVAIPRVTQVPTSYVAQGLVVGADTGMVGVGMVGDGTVPTSGITATGSLPAQSAAVSAAIVGSSSAVGSIGAQAAALTSLAVGSSAATAALAAAASALAGVVTVAWVAAGALTAGTSSVSGSAAGSSAASGTLAAQSSAASGAATGSSTASGTLAAQGSAVSGTVTGSSSASGTLAAQAATISATGTGSSTASGTLSAQSASLSGTDTVSGGGPGASGTLAAQASSLSGSVVVSSTASGTLAAQAATVAGAVSGSSTASGALAAQAASIAASGTTAWALTGALAAQHAIMGAGATASWVSTGSLSAQAASIAATAAGSSSATGAFVASGSALGGNFIASSVASGSLVARSSFAAASMVVTDVAPGRLLDELLRGVVAAPAHLVGVVLAHPVIIGTVVHQVGLQTAVSTASGLVGVVQVPQTIKGAI